MALLIGHCKTEISTLKVQIVKFWGVSVDLIFGQDINLGSYMSAHILLNLLNELRKRDKIPGLLCILYLF